MGSPQDEADLAEELKLIRVAIERYRRSTWWSFVLSGLTVLALLVSVGVGVIARTNDHDNARRDQRNLVRLVRTGCEDNNDRAVTNAEVLISTVAGATSSEETKQFLEEYRKNVRDSLTDCDARVAILTDRN